MKKAYFFVSGAAMIVFSIAFAGGLQRLPGSDTLLGKVMAPEGGAEADSTSKKGLIAFFEQPQEVMTVSPRILIGCWSGKDSLGKRVSFLFLEPPEGEPAVLHVKVQIGKRSVKGVCSYWENNMCDLKLETKDIQNVRSRWFFKYDGTWMTIQLGDGQLIAGSNIYKIKKDK